MDASRSNDKWREFYIPIFNPKSRKVAAISYSHATQSFSFPRIRQLLYISIPRHYQRRCKSWDCLFASEKPWSSLLCAQNHNGNRALSCTHTILAALQRGQGEVFSSLSPLLISTWTRGLRCILDIKRLLNRSHERVRMYFYREETHTHKLARALFNKN